MPRPAHEVPVEAVDVAAYRIPTSKQPESDGTLEWDSTPMAVVHVHAGGERGFGYAYGHPAAALIIKEDLAPELEGRDALAVEAAWEAMRRTTRNTGFPGVVASAIGVLDVALWDLKAKLLDVPVSDLLGRRRDRVPLYGSGGFTSLSDAELSEQLAALVDAGISRVKMKIGTEPDRDPERVQAAREAVGPDVELFVDANGAFTPSDALEMADRLAALDVSWFEEPVSSDDRVGLRRVRDHSPPGIRIAAGEYGWDAPYFRRMCEDACVDVLQPDVIRTAGFTGFVKCAEICDAFGVPISAHTAPQLDAHVCLATPRTLHAELFHDHDRIDRMLLEGALEPEDGCLRPDPGRPGLGLSLRSQDAEPYRVL